MFYVFGKLRMRLKKRAHVIAFTIPGIILPITIYIHSMQSSVTYTWEEIWPGFYCS